MKEQQRTAAKNSGIDRRFLFREKTKMRALVLVVVLFITCSAFPQESASSPKAILPKFTLMGELPGKSKFDFAPTVSELFEFGV